MVVRDVAAELEDGRRSTRSSPCDDAVLVEIDEQRRPARRQRGRHYTRRRSRRLVGITALVLVLTAIAGASNASADVPGPITTRVTAILNAAGSWTTGTYVKQVGGPVIAAQNENFAFAPASTIKVLLDLYATTASRRGTPTT